MRRIITTTSRLVFTLLFLSQLVPFVRCACVFTQNCTDGMCDLPVNVSDPTPFMVANWTSTPQCPDLQGKGQPVCCSDGQNSNMMGNFFLISMLFGGGDGGGCDNCAANMIRFWCYFTCSPKQSDFMTLGPIIEVVDPISGQLINASNVTFKVNPESSCALYKSCASTQYVTEVSAMQSAFGFLNFQGENAVTKARMLVNIEYTDDGLYIPTNPCDYKIMGPADQYGYPVNQNCSCNNCQEMCWKDDDFTSKLKMPRVMEGFNPSLVLGALGVALLSSVISHFMRKKSPVDSASVLILEENDQKQHGANNCIEILIGEFIFMSTSILFTFQLSELALQWVFCC
eukprot:TRINITY_DN12084_c0_g1_i1.p1 TRINITY_DN12084_c0_g1~~TRINITY_DN12084_c0_g1_i1.p1  ORF type:complete len:343 (-),score=4.48 TRINITY_DN12084_c0_g1_i1:120-1148(-)